MPPKPPPVASNTAAWRGLEIGFWVALVLVNAVANSLTVWWETRRGDPAPDAWQPAAWEPAVWEASSGLMVLALIPALAWFTRRFPLHFDTWFRQLPWHVLGSVVFSLIHVAGMVALRELTYATQGQTYDFGPWGSEWLYEYVKDVRAYAMIVA
ncbi:MAG: LytTR family transcriptional regulator, partial [Silanimonas sp.]